MIFERLVLRQLWCLLMDYHDSFKIRVSQHTKGRDLLMVAFRQVTILREKDEMM